MGLDVNLYRKSVQKLTDDEGNDLPYKECIWGYDEQDSEKYPEHLFKRGYFRSSYNDGGINNLFRRLGIPDLYYIFDVDNVDSNTDNIDWKKARERCVEVMDLYEKRTSEVGEHDVYVLGRGLRVGLPPLLDWAVENSKEALQRFLDTMKEVKERKRGSDGWWGSREGDFFCSNFPRLKAAIPGKCGEWYLVYEGCPDADSWNEWYHQALEITLETIDYVLAQDDPSDFALSWFG